MVLRVEVVWIEIAHPLEHCFILFVHQVRVFPLTMRRIKGMIANHVERFGWKIILYDVIEIFVVTPGKMHLIKTAPVRVDTCARLVAAFGVVGIFGKELVEDDFIRPAAADRKRIADHRPLWLAKEAKNLPQVVNQSCKNEPAGMAILANLLRGLQEMLQLRK